MNTIAPVGVSLRTSFIFATPSLLQAAFTISVFKNGSVGSAAGITITYIAGLEYDVLIDASLGFVNAAGNYTLVISQTANPNNSWSETFIITPAVYQVQGGFANPIATFVTSSGNGRVTNGSSPIQGAVVTITRPNGSILTQKITDVNGVYGTIVFDTTGTFQVTAQAAGYQAASINISVSGSVATGPGTDLALSSVASVGTLSASTLWAYARRMYKDHVGSKADAEIRDAVNEALWMVASSKDWQWYQTVGTLRFRQEYTSSVATITLDSDVLTFASALPSWIDDSSDILLPDGQWYPILTRDSNTQLTLTTAYPQASTTAQCQIAKCRYDLPSDCRNIEKIISSDTWIWGNQPVSPATIEMMKRRIQTFNPAWTVERGNLCVWPLQNKDITAVYLYWRKPVALTTSTDLADIDERYIELLRRAIDFQIAARADCVAGDRVNCLQAFKETLGRVAPNDTGLASPETAPPSMGFNPFAGFHGKVV